MCNCLYLIIMFFFFFFNDTATTEIYTLSLHDALPILLLDVGQAVLEGERQLLRCGGAGLADRKSTRLNSSHVSISYAVFCLKKKKKIHLETYNIKNQTKLNSHHIPNPTIQKTLINTVI